MSFPASNTTVNRGDMLTVTTTNGELVGLSGWEWFVDDELDATQTGATFERDTTGMAPGQYIISATVLCGGVRYSGSIRVTITY